IFGSSKIDSGFRPLSDIMDRYPHVTQIGCSTSGEIYDTLVYDDSLSVALLEFEKTVIETAEATVENASDSYEAGEQIAQALLKPDLTAIFLLSDGMNVNGSELVSGMNAFLPPEVIVTGGLAGDGPDFKETWVLNNAGLHKNKVIAIGFYGDSIRIGHGSKGGWDIFGPERLVTRSSGNTLYELDGKPALELYKQYLGERANGLPSTALLFPLALRESAEDDQPIVRTILSVDESNQAMIFAGDIPKGYRAQLMKANFDRLIDGAASAALNSKSQALTDAPMLSIAISCVGRRLVLGERTDEELEATLDALPEQVQQIGFYSYGEISPFATGHCDLHNQTMTLTTITEQVD
ncbi:MAG: FIST N-terminal domain-containing protein, partial [Chloroflexota bacterium]